MLTSYTYLQSVGSTLTARAPQPPLLQGQSDILDFHTITVDPGRCSSPVVGADLRCFRSFKLPCPFIQTRQTDRQIRQTAR
eukprot:760968-Hanusia_phi.AAC.1